MNKKEMEQLVRKIEDQGIRVKICKGSSHYKVYAPKGLVFMGRTPSSSRSIINVKMDLKRKGVNVG